MRQLSRLLQELQKQHASASLIDVIDTRYFDDIVIAVKSLCKFDETEHLKVDTPSLALKLGHSLKKCAQLVKTIALKRNDDIMLKKAKRFLELFENEMDLVEIGGKRGRKVPILLSTETREAVELLISSRPVGISKANKYVFARPTKESQGHLRGWDCLHDSVQEVKNLKEPAYITSTKLRKYIATVSQTAALTEVDVDWLARHLGHDVRVHREFYRLHESTAELGIQKKIVYKT
ncbi:hypothetical protein QZH41_018050 [Actinostola sp. cb2023]|nr:hypothetical protein QZH41_018050 [Actinostola sp. cb2023]